MSDRREVEIQVDNDRQGFTMELWTELPNILTLSIVSPSGEIVPSISIKQGTYSVIFNIESGCDRNSR